MQHAGSLVADGADVPVQAGEFLATATRSPSSWSRCTTVVPCTSRTWPPSGPAPTSPSSTFPSAQGPLPGGSSVQLEGTAPAVTIAISKKPGENAIDVTRAVLERIELLRGTFIPDGVEVTVTRDYGVTANDKAQKLIQKLACSRRPPSCCWCGSRSAGARPWSSARP